jgi:hypothetical protein
LKPICYLDLDGVVADFHRGWIALHDVPLAYSDLTYDFPTQVGLPTFDNPHFWAVLTYDFWVGLAMTPDADEILKIIEAHFPADQVVVLSRVHDSGDSKVAAASAAGKIAWIGKHMPKYRDRYFVGCPKWAAAGPGKVLVDDLELSVDPFVEAGGRAILVPRPWNRESIRCDVDGRFCLHRFEDDLLREKNLVRTATEFEIK